MRKRRGWGGGGGGPGRGGEWNKRSARPIRPWDKPRQQGQDQAFSSPLRERECKRHCQAGCQIAQTFAILGQERSLRFARSSSHYCPYFSVITGFFRYPVMSAAIQHYSIFFHFCISLHFQSFLYLHLTSAWIMEERNLDIISISSYYRKPVQLKHMKVS